MSYTPTNVTIYNAAQAAAAGALVADRESLSATATDYAALAAQSLLVAQAVDTACTTTSTLVKEADLMANIVAGFFKGRYQVWLTNADAGLVAMAKACFAIWTETKGSLA